MLVPTIIYFLIACVTSLVLTVLVRQLAPHIGLTDRPDGHRKLHGKPMPLGGGIAIFLSTAGVIVALLVIPNQFRGYLHNNFKALPGLLTAAGVLVIVGLIDDRIGLGARKKLVGQVIAVSILMASGLLIKQIGMFGIGPFTLVDWVAVPVTLFWLLGAINALNLLDGIDGLATMMGIILVATIAAIAVMFGRPQVAIVASIFAGSLVGFIRFNFPPASIYLGDTGSMLVGLMVGALAIEGSLKATGTVLLAAPLAVWAIPIFDVVAAIVRRRLTGRSIFTTDRGHLHHRLLSLLGSNRRVLMCLTACCMLTSAAALLSVFLNLRKSAPVGGDLIALLICLAVVIIFIATGVFGQAELLLLGSRLKRVGRSLVPPLSANRDRIRETTIRMQGSRQWRVLWETFTESADRLSLIEIRLDVNLPAAQEGYHATWERPALNTLQQGWRVELPLMIGGRPVGRLVVAGERDEGSARESIQQLLELVEPLENQLLAVSNHRPAPAAVDPLTDENRAVAADSANDAPASDNAAADAAVTDAAATHDAAEPAVVDVPQTAAEERPSPAGSALSRERPR